MTERSPQIMATFGTVAALACASTLARPSGRSLLVLGGSGFVGREVCRNAVQRGFAVTSLSRRGENPEPSSPDLSAVRWVSGDATDAETVRQVASGVDAAVHAVGLLFDAESGLGNLNVIVSGSRSVPSTVAGVASTYDRITRLTAFNLIDVLRSTPRPSGSGRVPLCFVSAAEAGWPDVSMGPQVEQTAPEWLKRYLIAKRAVERELAESRDTVRGVIFRPSLIWNWRKIDVLPVIPIFNLLSALGVPFVDKTVRVETLAKAIVVGLEDVTVEGVQRYPEIERLSATITETAV